MKKAVKESCVCCDGCFESIAKKSCKAARLWIDLCAHQDFKGKVLAVAKFASKELRELEINGFIVSHEREDSIVVRVEGYHEEPCIYFCVGVCNGT